MTPSEINEAVARKLGVKVVDESDPYPRPLDDYCHSIEAAWEIVGKFGGKDRIVQLFYLPKFGKWIFCISGKDQSVEVVARGESDIAPMAIALCFLKLP